MWDAMSKRLEYLQRIVGAEGGQRADSFAWYGLAMEYRGLARHEEALKTFEGLRARDPGYVPMYLMCAQMLGTMGRGAEARTWLVQGVEAAKKQGNGHALSELESALETLGHEPQKA